MCRTDPYRKSKDVPPFEPAEAKGFAHCMNWMYDPKAGKRVYCVHKPGHKSPCKFGSK